MRPFLGGILLLLGQCALTQLPLQTSGSFRERVSKSGAFKRLSRSKSERRETQASQAFGSSSPNNAFTRGGRFTSVRSPETRRPRSRLFSDREEVLVGPMHQVELDKLSREKKKKGFFPLMRRKSKPVEQPDWVPRVTIVPAEEAQRRAREITVDSLRTAERLGLRRCIGKLGCLGRTPSLRKSSPDFGYHRRAPPDSGNEADVATEVTWRRRSSSEEGEGEGSKEPQRRRSLAFPVGSRPESAVKASRRNSVPAQALNSDLVAVLSGDDAPLGPRGERLEPIPSPEPPLFPRRSKPGSETHVLLSRSNTVALKDFDRARRTVVGSTTSAAHYDSSQQRAGMPTQQSKYAHYDVPTGTPRPAALVQHSDHRSPREQKVGEASVYDTPPSRRGSRVERDRYPGYDTPRSWKSWLQEERAGVRIDGSKPSASQLLGTSDLSDYVEMSALRPSSGAPTAGSPRFERGTPRGSVAVEDQRGSPLETPYHSAVYDIPPPPVKAEPSFQVRENSSSAMAMLNRRIEPTSTEAEAGTRSDVIQNKRASNVGNSVGSGELLWKRRDPQASSADGKSDATYENLSSLKLEQLGATAGAAALTEAVETRRAHVKGWIPGVEKNTALTATRSDVPAAEGTLKNIVNPLPGQLPSRTKSSERLTQPRGSLKKNEEPKTSFREAPHSDSDTYVRMTYGRGSPVDAVVDWRTLDSTPRVRKVRFLLPFDESEKDATESGSLRPAQNTLPKRQMDTKRDTIPHTSLINGKDTLSRKKLALSHAKSEADPWNSQSRALQDVLVDSSPHQTAGKRRTPDLSGFERDSNWYESDEDFVSFEDTHTARDS